MLRGKAGQVLSHEYCQKRPIITWNGRKDGQYTLAMISRYLLGFLIIWKFIFLYLFPLIVTDYHTELDPTTNRTRVTHYNEYIQWLVVNIPGRRYKLGKLVVWYSVPEKPLTKGNTSTSSFENSYIVFAVFTKCSFILENMYLVFLIYRQPERYNETIVNGMLDPPM